MKDGPLPRDILPTRKQGDSPIFPSLRSRQRRARVTYIVFIVLCRLSLTSIFSLFCRFDLFAFIDRLGYFITETLTQQYDPETKRNNNISDNNKTEGLGGGGGDWKGGLRKNKNTETEKKHNKSNTAAETTKYDW